MAGIDRKDQMLAYNACERKTLLYRSTYIQDTK